MYNAHDIRPIPRTIQTGIVGEEPVCEKGGARVHHAPTLQFLFVELVRAFKSASPNPRGIGRLNRS
jgi:hypothetical protein